jgi:UDP-glucose 4-epimerase
MKVLVTGGAGFIGSHLVDFLVDKGYEVNVLIRKGDVHPSYKDDQPKEILKHIKNLKVNLFYGNLLDKNSLKDACKDVEKVYHLAAIAHEYEGLPEKIYFDVNVEGTKNLLDVCMKNDVKRFLFTSTIEATGPSVDGKPVDEETKPNPVCIYGKSKLEGENLCKDYKEKYNFPISIVRPPMIYGDRNPLHERLFKNVKRRVFPVFDGGETLFEFCYVKNQAYGMYLINEKKKAIGETYFISEGSYKIKEVVRKAAEVMGVDLKIISIPKSFGYLMGLAGEILSIILPFPPFKVRGTGRPYISRRTIWWTTNSIYICDNSKAKKELGYKPPFSLEKGLEKTIKWYEKNGII